MSQQWSPEIAITPEEAQSIIETQFPQLEPVSISELGKGFDNTVFIVNDRYVFRFPRREIAVQLLNIENQLLPLLTKELNIKIPEPIFFGKPSDSFKWPFTGYHHVLGKAPSHLSAETRKLSAAALGQFFKKLHEFPVEQGMQIGIPYDRFERMNIGKRKVMLVENLKKAAQLQLMDNAGAAYDWLNSMKEVPKDSPITLVHGDCHIRNILVDEEGVISGIIDWGDTHLGNPAIDLSIAYSFLPPSGRELFFQEYGEVSEELRMLAKFFAVYVSVILLLYGHDVKDDRLVVSAKESFKLALS